MLLLSGIPGLNAPPARVFAETTSVVVRTGVPQFGLLPKMSLVTDAEAALPRGLSPQLFSIVCSEAYSS